MERFKNIKRVAINELEKLDTAYAGKDEFTPADCEKLDKMAHGLKCLLTACAMLDSENYGMEPVHEPMSGNYPGYSGYAYGPGYSGHYPPHPMYPERRW